MIAPAVPRALVVGAGYAGRRLLAALRHLEPSGAVEVAGVVDRDQSKLEPLRREELWLSTSLRAGLEHLDPDVVVVAVNEGDHGEVLHLLGMGRSRWILCEKPLAPTVEEASLLEAVLGHCRFSMNMVERYSLAVMEAADWLRSFGPLDPVRVEFQWGKHRIGDPRPTIGVASEIIHPLDLVRFLFGLETLTSVTNCATSSNLRFDRPAALDWLSFAATADSGFPVIGAASFSWPRRVRTVNALLRDGGGNLHRLMLSLDTPHWDHDSLLIESIDRDTGRYRPVHSFATSTEDDPKPVRGINKVVRFVEETLATWAEQRTGVPLVDLREAIALQRLVHMACSSQVTDEMNSCTLWQNAESGPHSVGG